MRRPISGVLLSCAVASAWIACGDRTGLLVDDFGQVPDAQPTERPQDAVAPFDVVRREAAARDAAPDALPTIDAAKRDANRSDCPDAAATLVYVLTQQNELFSFYPPTAAFTRIGLLACPGAGGSTPWSMAVDRRGTAYALFDDGRIWRVSTATAACVATSFVPGQQGFLTFGMGFVANTSDPGETLFVAENTFGAPSKGLGAVDVSTFVLRSVGDFSPPIPRAELTGTGEGRLFAFFPNDAASGSHVVEIDRSNARVLAQNSLAVGLPDDAFAFAYWGGSFWIFTAPGGPSTVTRFDPLTQTETFVGTMPSTIVGAGVSTCAPQ